MRNTLNNILMAVVAISLGAQVVSAQTESDEPQQLSAEQQRVETVEQETVESEALEEESAEEESEETTPVPVNAEEMAAVYESERMFAMNLTASVAESMPNGNFVVSPYGVYECLNVLAVAANPEAGGQIAEAIGLTPNRSYATELAQIRRSHIPYVPPVDPGTTDDGRTLTVESPQPVNPFVTQNLLLLDHRFRFAPGVAEAVVAPFGIAPLGVDWTSDESVELVNSHVNRMFAEATSDRMTDLNYNAPQLGEYSASLVNLCFFGAGWSTEFSEIDPENAPPMMFRIPTADGVQEVSVPYMQHAALTAFYHENEAFQLVELPYRNSVLGMVLVLPAEGVSELEVLKALVAENCLGSRADRPQGAVAVKINIPKFAFETSEIDLESSCSRLGITSVFEPGCGLEDLFEHDQPLFVDRLSQNAMIQVDEQGTVAAAITKVDIIPLGGPEAEKEFIADRPFMFFISDVYGGVYFAGRVADPQSDN